MNGWGSVPSEVTQGSQPRGVWVELGSFLRVCQWLHQGKGCASSTSVLLVTPRRYLGVNLPARDNVGAKRGQRGVRKGCEVDLGGGAHSQMLAKASPTSVNEGLPVPFLNFALP